MSRRSGSLLSSLPFQLRAVRTWPLLLVAALVAGGLLTGCDTAGDDDPGGTAYLEGYVVSSSGNPVDGALVTAEPGGETTRSDSAGFYSLAVEVDSTMDITVTAEKEGYQRTSNTAIARAGETTPQNLRLTPTGADPEEDPGTPTNILLLSQTREAIGVKESGAPEVARVTFQVTDSTGRPIDLDEATQVQFSLGQAPADAFIAPQSASTNDNGEVTVNVSSGTTAGVVQIVASADTDTGTIRSRPVGLTIHGGLPDQAHFTVGPEQFNFPGLITAGLTNTVNIIVGDQYGNPVVPGTSVYFTSSAGIIEGDTQTDEQGRGSVTLISGQPYPTQGIAVIEATTANDQEQPVTDRVPVLLSDGGILKVTAVPGHTFAQPLDMRDEDDVETLMNALGDDFPFGGYEFIVEDRNGNPLPEGTTVGFQAGGTEVGTSGDTGVALDDTEFVDQNGDGDALDYADVVRGRGITSFSASAVRADDPGTAEQPDVESITFSFTGPRSSRTYTFSEPESNTNSAPAVVFSRNGKPAARLSDGVVVWTE